MIGCTVEYSDKSRCVNLKLIIILIVDMMTNFGLEFMIMIIHPWLSDNTPLPISTVLPPPCFWAILQ